MSTQHVDTDAEDGHVRQRVGGPSGPEVLLIEVGKRTAAAHRDVGLLSADEHSRIAAFVHEADKDRYRVAHVALRQELGARLSTAPEDITFIQEPCPCCDAPHGRPAVPGAPLHFSLSHAEDLVLIAFAPVTIGADVERQPSLRSADSTTSALHPTEQRELGGLPAELRPAAFARCWTRKEAYLKGTGAGLGEDPAVTYVGAGQVPGTVPGWKLFDVPVATGYAAAVAVRQT